MVDITTICYILYLWIEWELAVMGTPTKVYSLIEILLSIIRVYLKRVFQVLKRELFNDMSLIHGMVGIAIYHT